MCGHYGDVAAQARQAAQDVELGAVVDGNHLVAWRRLVAVALAARPARLVPAIGMSATHLGGEVHALQARPLRGSGPAGLQVQRAVGAFSDGRVLRYEVAHRAGEGAGGVAAATDQV